MASQISLDQALNPLRDLDSPFFGHSVAIDRDRIVISAIAEDSDGSDPGNNTSTDQGAVYVFERVGDDWANTAYLKAGNGQAGDRFGVDVGLVGDQIIVGADDESRASEQAAPASLPQSGAAYLYRRVGPDWVQQRYIKASNASAGDRFGNKVAIDDQLILIGSPDEDSAADDPLRGSSENSGAAYLFEIPLLVDSFEQQ